MYQICRLHVQKIIAKSCTIGAYLVKLVFFTTALLFRLRTNLESTCMAFKTTCSIDLPLPKLLRRCYRVSFHNVHLECFYCQSFP